MSFTVVTPRSPRLNRCQLSVPGIRPALFEKAAASAADVIVLDLEDAVAPDDKAEAREHVIAAINQVDWGEKSLSVRINSADTHYMYRDVVDLLERTEDRLDMLMLPKVGVAGDVYALDMLVTQIETAHGRKKPIGLELIVESALGLANIDSIAGASPRLESLHFGAADYAASTGARTTQVGGQSQQYGVLSDPDPDGVRAYHWNDIWHYPLARIVVAARAHGLRPIDGAFGDYRDVDGYTAQANRAAALGCLGKWAIHPTQIALANTVFTPSEADITEARRVLEAMDQAMADGLGAVSLDGRLIDIASIRQAENLVGMADQIAAQSKIG